MIVGKPWGTYKVIYEDAGMVIKIIHVLPGHRLSLQKHKFRDEHWIILEGIATIRKYLTLVEEFEWGKNACIHIPKNAWHRLSNKTTKNLYVLEIQRGNCLEDDIERREDDYNRV
jgi:mannose-6-phosphate isomerase-like protein (cupin superfamily)